MANKKQEAVFTPIGLSSDNTGKVEISVDLPEPTDKNHKDLGLSEEDVVVMFEQMYLQRRFEERAMQMYQKGKFGGLLHLYIGLAAISNGSVFDLYDVDYIIRTYSAYFK